MYAGSSDDPDFGGALAASFLPPIIREENAINTNNLNFIYMTGCRSGEDVVPIGSQLTEFGKWSSSEQISHEIKFLGISGGMVDYFSDDASQFRFGNAANDVFAGNITNWLGNLLLSSGDSTVDFNDVPMTPSFTGTAWSGGVNFVTNKGAFEQ